MRIIWELPAIKQRTFINTVDTSSCTLREANSLHRICQDRVTSMGFRIQKVIRINSFNKTARIGNCQATILNRHADTAQQGIVAMTKGIDQCFTKSTRIIEEDLLAEVQRLRAENAYLKNLQALVLEEERRQRKKRR